MADAMKNAGAPLRQAPQTGLPTMTIEQALADPNPLVAFQARRQREYESGKLSIDADLLMALVPVWERNRTWARYHQLKS
jgi:hypothetical protein